MSEQVTVQKHTSGNNCKDGDKPTPSEKGQKVQSAAVNKMDQGKFAKAKREERMSRR